MTTPAQPKKMTLWERIYQIDKTQARRFEKLNGIPKEIATEGIVRLLRSCKKQDVPVDSVAVREIIDDALNGRRVYAESDTTYTAPAGSLL